MFHVWAKSKQGQRSTYNAWEFVYSWHKMTTHDTKEEAEQEMSKHTPSSETPAYAVRPADDDSLFGAG